MSGADQFPFVSALQDPTKVLDDYGADALRLYLINSPVVRAEPLRFREEGVFAVVKEIFLPWYNAYRFLVQNVRRQEAETGTRFDPAQVVLFHQVSVQPCAFGGRSGMPTDDSRTACCQI